MKKALEFFIKSHKVPVAVFIISFLIRAAFALSQPEDFTLTGDPKAYDNIAVNLLSGRGFLCDYTKYKASYAPLYPMFIAFSYLLFGRSLFYIRLLQCLLSALVSALIYLAGREAFDELTGRAAALLSAFYPFLIYYNAYEFTENLYIFLYMLALYVFLKGLYEGRTYHFILSGVLLGYASLTRPVISAFLPFLLFSALLYGFRRKNARLAAKDITKFILTSLFMAAILIPWGLRNYIELGKFVTFTTEGGRAFYAGNNPMNKTGGAYRYIDYIEPERIMKGGLSEIEESAALKKEGIRFIVDNKTAFIRLSVKKALYLWKVFPAERSGFSGIKFKMVSLLSYGLLLPFFIAGLLYSLPKIEKTFVLSSFLVYNTLFCMVFFSSMRFRDTLAPIMLIYAAYGMKRFFEKLNLLETKR